MRKLIGGTVVLLSMATGLQAAVLVPPANLGELAVASDAVVLAVAGESRVERRSGGGAFRVTAFNAAGASPPSNTATVTIPRLGH